MLLPFAILISFIWDAPSLLLTSAMWLQPCVASAFHSERKNSYLAVMALFLCLFFLEIFAFEP
jgi:hypothetical protein